MIRHTQECRAHMETQKNAQRVWKRKWPDHCDECSGYGVFSRTENVAGYGDPPIMMEDADPCSSCTERGRCPRCGKIMNTEEEKPCPHCGWNWAKSDSDTMPTINCICQEDQ